jgi:hypothetical protein
MDNKKLTDILDKMLEQAAERLITNYVFYCSVNFKCDITNYKGYDVFYTDIVKENNIYLSPKQPIHGI